ncbi:MAG: hypothetical protein JWP11_46 [Frankiales bacterium]|nr:hypothetical protein [Frankiales bacterium]
MAAAVRAVGALTAGSGDDSVTVYAPAGTVAGDLLLAMVTWNANDSTVNTPAGWTLLRRGTYNDTYALFYRRAAGAGAAPTTFTSPGGLRCQGVILALSGVGASVVPVLAYTEEVSGASRSTVVAPSLAAHGAGLLLALFGIDEFLATSALGAPAGMTLRVSGQATSANQQLLVADQHVAGGATGTRAASLSNPSTKGALGALVLVSDGGVYVPPVML